MLTYGRNDIVAILKGANATATFFYSEYLHRTLAQRYSQALNGIALLDGKNCKFHSRVSG